MSSSNIALVLPRNTTQAEADKAAKAAEKAKAGEKSARDALKAAEGSADAARKDAEAARKEAEAAAAKARGGHISFVSPPLWGWFLGVWGIRFLHSFIRPVVCFIIAVGYHRVSSLL